MSSPDSSGASGDQEGQGKKMPQRKPEEEGGLRFQFKITEVPSNAPAILPDGTPDFVSFVAALRNEARRLTTKVVEDDDLEEEEVPTDAARLFDLANLIERFAEESGYR